MASPIFSPPPPPVQTYVPSARLHTSTVHIHGHGVQREPAQLRRHSPPVFALAWHGTASLFGHFRPGQAPPTFILITSWFAPGFCSPSFFPSERFPTADAWEPHLCPLAYSCPGPCDAGLDVSLSLSLSSYTFPPSSRRRSRGNTATMRFRRDGARLMEIFT